MERLALVSKILFDRRVVEQAAEICDLKRRNVALAREALCSYFEVCISSSKAVEFTIDPELIRTDRDTFPEGCSVKMWVTSFHGQKLNGGDAKVDGSTVHATLPKNIVAVAAYSLVDGIGTPVLISKVARAFTGTGDIFSRAHTLSLTEEEFLSASEIHNAWLFFIESPFSYWSITGTGLDDIVNVFMKIADASASFACDSGTGNVGAGGSNIRTGFKRKEGGAWEKTTEACSNRITIY